MANDRLSGGVVLIYGLVDPIKTHLRYVGKTWYSLSKRRKQHLGHSKNPAVKAWVASLRDMGTLPEIFEIERVTASEWQEQEKFWIAYFRFIGCDLLNLHEGGGGSVPLSEYARRRIAEGFARWASNPNNIQAQKERAKAAWRDPKHRARSLAAIKAAVTPELCRMRSELKKKDWATNPEYRKNFAAAQAKVDRSSLAKEFWKRPEYLARRAESIARRRARGPWVSEEQKRKQSVAMKARRPTPEQIESHRKASTRRTRDAEGRFK